MDSNADRIRFRRNIPDYRTLFWQFFKCALDRDIPLQIPEPAILAAVLQPAVDVPARPVDATVPVPALSPAVPEPATYGVYPLIILIVYVIVTGGIL